MDFGHPLFIRYPKFKTLDISLLDHNIGFILWQVKMLVFLVHLDLDDALTGIDKIHHRWVWEKSSIRNKKLFGSPSLFVQLDFAGHSKGEN